MVYLGIRQCILIVPIFEFEIIKYYGIIKKYQTNTTCSTFT